MADRTESERMRKTAYCEECGEELWGPQERSGLCIHCQQREAEDFDYVSGDENHDD